MSKQPRRMGAAKGARSQGGRGARWPTRLRSTRFQWGAIAVVVAALLAGVAVLQGGFGSSTPGGAPDFHMVAYQGQGALGGDELDFSQLFGPEQTQPVVLNFWAGSCPPCRAEMPGFQRVYEDTGDRFLMVGVDIGPYTGLGSHDDARQLLQELDITYPAVYATDDPTRSYNVQGMPTTVFLTPDGSIFSKRTGFLPEGELRSRLQDLLASSSQ